MRPPFRYAWQALLTGPAGLRAAAADRIGRDWAPFFTGYREPRIRHGSQPADIARPRRAR